MGRGMVGTRMQLVVSPVRDSPRDPFHLFHDLALQNITG